jgi:hypothetical protein
MKPDMAKLPGLFPRNGAGYLRVVIPHELSTVCASKRAIVESLRTKAVLQAKVKATIRRATLLARFEQLHPQAVERVTPEMGKMLFERVTARILGLAERLRTEPETARPLMEAIRSCRRRHSLAIGPLLRTGAFENDEFEPALIVEV